MWILYFSMPTRPYLIVTCIIYGSYTHENYVQVCVCVCVCSVCALCVCVVWCVLMHLAVQCMHCAMCMISKHAKATTKSV